MKSLNTLSPSKTLSKNIVKISAAGSGKTWNICRDAMSYVEANPDKRVLITTFSNGGIKAIEDAILRQNSGIIPNNIVVRSWDKFLLRDLIKPYQNKISGIGCNEIMGMVFDDETPQWIYRILDAKQKFCTSSGNVYSKMASKMVKTINDNNHNIVFQRLELVYSKVYIDEIQDLAGYDLYILEQLIEGEIDTYFAGDNRQHTFATHRTKDFKMYSGKNIWNFFNLHKDKIVVDYSLESRRCAPAICDFANKIYRDKNRIFSNAERTSWDGVFCIDPAQAKVFYENFKPQVLRYSKRSKLAPYITSALNFGECKGLTFDNVLIFPNRKLLDFIAKGAPLKSPEKYYVAVTRARHKVVFVVDDVSVIDGEPVVCNIGKDQIVLARLA